MPAMRPAAHLLLIDDENEFLVLTRLLLELEGFEVSTAPGGEQAVALVEGGLRPDLVVIDYRMPRLNGSQTLARLKAAGLRVPALLVSAVAEIEQTAANNGFDACLAKPFAVEELLQLTRQMLERSAPA